MNYYATDANVIFASLISGKENYEQMFAKNKFYLPDFALTEIQKYQPTILSKTQLSFDELKTYTLGIFDRITVVPNLLISTKSFFDAFHLCKDIDEKDTPYLALAIEFNIKLLTNDLELMNGLKRKGFNDVLSLTELFELLKKEIGNQ